MSLKQLRAHAIRESLFEPTTLEAALERMSFVQADPIRSPARAQDLILRHRVVDYRAGQLEREYPGLAIEEDVLYAYGFLTRRVWQLLQPRRMGGLGVLENRALDAVKHFGETHPRDLQAHIGRRRVINAWGGYSAATTQALERLRHRGLLRIARRENGIRIYAPAHAHDESLKSDERIQKLIMTVARILAPIPEKSLRALANRYRRWGLPRAAVDTLLQTGELERHTADGIVYLTPAASRGNADDEGPRQVRFLSPFDPVVWDRGRFEHFWGWPYRFEAYTPAAKRVRGYYAMPLLWGARVIGWANVALRNTQLHVELGFVGKQPRESAFRAEIEREIESLRIFLNRAGPLPLP
jgi:uncharacterized protein YcaQ